MVLLGEIGPKNPFLLHHEGCRSCACESGVEEGSCFLKGTSPKGKERLRKTTVPPGPKTSMSNPEAEEPPQALWRPREG